MITVPDIVGQSSQKQKNKIAVIYKKQKISYLDLKQRTDRLAAALPARLGLGRGERVGILLKNCPEYIISYFAMLQAGGVVVPLNTFLTAEELNYILNDCQVDILVTAAGFLPVVQTLIARYRRPLKVILVDKKAAGCFYWPEMAEFAGSTAPGPLRFDADDLAVILYTSGTTGYPKGAMLTHGNLLADIEACCRAVALREKDIFILFLPMFHAFTFTVCVLLPLYLGARTVIMDSVMPFHRVLRTLIVNRVTVFVSIPLVYKLLLKARIPRMFFWLLPLRLCVSGGAPLGANVQSTFERKFKIPLLEGYGLSEAAPVVTINPLSEVRRPGSIGLPLPGVEVRIVDDNGQELTANEVGEIVVRGPNVMKGYFKAPDLTAQALKEGWLYTGDMGRINQDGFIYIVDRKKDMILVHGMNVYPREVEEILLAHPQIAEAAVVGKKDEHHGEIPVAFIVLKKNGILSIKEIGQYCRTHLANYKVPRQIRLVEALPKTATGKVSKKELKDKA